ncbi:MULTISPECIES: LuxR C-terminal-related transcriptional regulator [Burkholderia cepacia complex]|uniref:DNA-binding response regulator n=1 Tax=Burkholderia contaminans TaxID=488447 RepID=A0A2S5DM79_9BURK|nr:MULTISPECIES: response regulator transcription factor [Burkholderia cepacia complex]MBR7919718.1 response regulator transcription factor [Burkholderia vietnamiensis]MBR8205221.1 response regulator transcription factor [Burkholderia vietnamiensis]POZ80192.1 DNA-binding response regulator [Burkholderia contaminans]
MAYALIAIQDALRCTGLEVLIRESAAAERCVAVQSATELVSSSRNLNECSLVVVDLLLNGLPTFDVIGRVRARAKNVGILALDVDDDGDRAMRALRSGATGVVSSIAPRRQLSAALTAVVEGRRFVQEHALATLLEKVTGDTATTSHEQLSNREYQTLIMLGRGMRLVEVAVAMSISVKTASTYRTRLIEKLGLRTTGELIRYAISQGLVLTGTTSAQRKGALPR